MAVTSVRSLIRAGEAPWLRVGEPPWQPTSNATSVRALLSYGHPSIGTFRIGDDLILFAVAYEDDDDKLSVWAYVPVPADAFQGQQFVTAASLRQYVNGCFGGHATVFAAANDLAIERWGIRNVNKRPDGLTDAATEFMWSVMKAESFHRLQAAVRLAEAENLVEPEHAELS
jgi:hypothetical protein